MHHQGQANEGKTHTQHCFFFPEQTVVVIKQPYYQLWLGSSGEFQTRQALSLTVESIVCHNRETICYICCCAQEVPLGRRKIITSSLAAPWLKVN